MDLELFLVDENGIFCVVDDVIIDVFQEGLFEFVYFFSFGNNQIGFFFFCYGNDCFFCFFFFGYEFC